MFDFLKSKKPLLFTIEVSLDPYNSDVLGIGSKELQIKSDGTAINCGKPAGRIPIWNYIKQFDTPRSMSRIDFNRFMIDVHGEADRTLIAEPVARKPYSYECVLTAYPNMIPNQEYLCSLVLNGDLIDVIVGGVKIGELIDKKKRGTIEKVEKMLGNGWRTTAMIYPSRGKLTLWVNILKV